MKLDAKLKCYAVTFTYIRTRDGVNQVNAEPSDIARCSTITSDGFTQWSTRLVETTAFSEEEAIGKALRDSWDTISKEDADTSPCHMLMQPVILELIK